MLKVKCHIIVLLLFVVLLSGCVGTTSNPKLTVEPIATSFDQMPSEAASIISAVALQTVTPSFKKAGNVQFAEGVNGLSDSYLSLTGFEFTKSLLYTYKNPSQGSPGKVAGEIEYTDLFDRKANYLFTSYYNRSGTDLIIESLSIKRKYSTPSDIKLVLVPSVELSNVTFTSYYKLIEVLADKAVVPKDLKRTTSEKEYTIFATTKDRISKGSKLNIAISASPSGTIGYAKSSDQFIIDGWPVATAVGTFNPADSSNPLFAKIVYKQAGASSSRLLGVFPLSAF